MRLFLAAILCVLPSLSAPVVKAPVVPDKVVDRFTPAPFDGQKIEGLLGDRMRVNLEGRLLHVDEKGILKGFQQRPGEQDWIGEHAGKFLHAAANTYLYTGDERLKTLMDRVVRAQIATQLPDGYLGTYLDARRWTSWDVWVHKYDLIGLTAYYQVTGYEPALDAARKIGDLLCRTFGTGPGQREIILSGEHVGMAATSVIEPMVNLYRYTGDRKYLDFCEYLVRSWGQANGPKIVESLNATGSVFHTANAKAYEMMSNLVGLAELYRATGNPLYLKTAQIAWDDIAAHRLFVTGTTSSNEHFTDDAVLPGEESANVGEGCATVTWLQLTWQLLRLTGEARYAEQLEHTVYKRAAGRAGSAHRRHLLFHAAQRQEIPHARHQLLRLQRAARHFHDSATGLGIARRWRRRAVLRSGPRHGSHRGRRDGHRRPDQLPVGWNRRPDADPGEGGALPALPARSRVDHRLYGDRGRADVQRRAGRIPHHRPPMETRR